jgi:hypothetical protein
MANILSGLRQPTDKFAGRGGFRAAKAESTNADNEWLSQIYGQHTIYRRDQVIHSTENTYCIRVVYMLWNWCI